MRMYSNRASSGRGSTPSISRRAAPTGGRRCSRMPTTVRFTCSSIPNARGGATAAAFRTASEPSRASWSIPRCAVTEATWDVMRSVRSTSATSPFRAIRPPPTPWSPSGTGTAITTAPSASRSRATRPAPRSRASRATVSFPTRARGFSRRPPGPGCGSIRSTTRAMRRTATARPCASTPPCGSIPTPATGSGSTTAAA